MTQENRKGRIVMKTIETLYSKLYEPEQTRSLPGVNQTAKGLPLLVATPEERRSALDDIGVRRLLIYLEKIIAEACSYTLFEFNDAFTRHATRDLLDPVLADLEKRGAIYDYAVICDESNNTPEVIASNEFVADIYIKPVPALKYIQLNFIATKTAVDFDETT